MDGEMEMLFFRSAQCGLAPNSHRTGPFNNFSGLENPMFIADNSRMFKQLGVTPLNARNFLATQDCCLFETRLVV